MYDCPDVTSLQPFIGQVLGEDDAIVFLIMVDLERIRGDQPWADLPMV